MDTASKARKLRNAVITAEDKARRARLALNRTLPLLARQYVALENRMDALRNEMEQSIRWLDDPGILPADDQINRMRDQHNDQIRNRVRREATTTPTVSKRVKKFDGPRRRNPDVVPSFNEDYYYHIFVRVFHPKLTIQPAFPSERLAPIWNYPYVTGEYHHDGWWSLPHTDFNVLENQAYEAYRRAWAEQHILAGFNCVDPFETALVREEFNDPTWAETGGGLRPCNQVLIPSERSWLGHNHEYIGYLSKEGWFVSDSCDEDRKAWFKYVEALSGDALVRELDRLILTPGDSLEDAVPVVEENHMMFSPNYTETWVDSDGNITDAGRNRYNMLCGRKLHEVERKQRTALRRYYFRGNCTCGSCFSDNVTCSKH